MKSTLINNTIVMAIGNFATKLINLILVPLYANWLLPEEYGNYDLISSVIIFVAPILSLQLEQAVFRFVYENKENEKVIVTQCINLVIILLLSVYCIMGFLRKFTSYYTLFFGYISCLCLFSILKEYIRGIGKIKEYVLFSLQNVMQVLLLSFVFVKPSQDKVGSILFVQVSSYLILIIIILIKEKPYDYKYIKLDKNLLKELLKFSIPLIPNTISFWIINLSDRLLITYYLGSYSNGIYAVACKVPTMISMLNSAFVLAWQQEAIGLIKNNDIQKVKTIFLNVIKFIFSILFITTIISPLIFRLFISKKYDAAVSLVPILLTGTAFLCIAQFFNGILVAKMKTLSVGVSTTIGAIINILINVELLKEFGVVIAAVSTLVSYFVLFIIRIIQEKTLAEKKCIILIVVGTVIEVILAYATFRLKTIGLVLLLFAICVSLFWLNKKHIIKKKSEI